MQAFKRIEKVYEEETHEAQWVGKCRHVHIVREEEGVQT
jgi:hypothetical protein